MPGGDRTGPMGHGAMTGRGAGPCGDFGGPGNTSGFRRGFGGGRGFRGGRGFGMEARRLEASLEAIKKRLDQLENQPPKESK